MVVKEIANGEGETSSTSDQQKQQTLGPLKVLRSWYFVHGSNFHTPATSLYEPATSPLAALKLQPTFIICASIVEFKCEICVLVNIKFDVFIID